MGSGASDETTGVLSGAFFSYGFRPFFLSAGCYAPIVVLFWLGVLAGGWPTPGGAPPIWWHGHEMVFGWATAAVCGFLLTAVPNWTSSPPVTGAGLALLWALWIVGRVGIWFSAKLPVVSESLPLLSSTFSLSFPIGWGAALDLLLIPGLLCFVLPPIVRRKQPRHYVFPVFLIVLWIADLLSLLPYTNAWPNRATTGLYLGTYVMIVMLTLIGGRVVPNFTRGALRAQGKEQGVQSSEMSSKAAALGVVLALVTDLVVRNLPGASMGVLVNGWMALLAALLLILRAKGWRFRETWRNPLLWILHVGQGWLIIAFAARGVSCLTGWVPPAAAFHALGAGAMASMILGFMTRAPLGHTGRPLRASRSTAVAYGLVIVAGVSRFTAALVPGYLQLPALALAGGCFAVAFAIYVVEYFPILTRPASN